MHPIKKGPPPAEGGEGLKGTRPPPRPAPPPPPPAAGRPCLIVGTGFFCSGLPRGVDRGGRRRGERLSLFHWPNLFAHPLSPNAGLSPPPLLVLIR